MSLDKKVMLQQKLQPCSPTAVVSSHTEIRAAKSQAFRFSPVNAVFTSPRPNLTSPPEGVRLPSGGILIPWRRRERPRMSFYGATMADFAVHLSQSSGGHPVQNHTGLTSRHDFVVNWVDDLDSKMPERFIASDDPYPLSHWDIESLGLHLAPTKLPVDTLVIDSIENPLRIREAQIVRVLFYCGVMMPPTGMLTGSGTSSTTGRLRCMASAVMSVYLRPAPVLKRTTLSVVLRSPEAMRAS
jgi:hypothetical protein